GVAGLPGEDLTGMRNYRLAECTYRGATMLIARTGYTGEDGFELYVADELAAPLWEQLPAAGGARLTPCGLACRDTLRLEAGMPLYGNELGRDLFPAQSGLGRVVALKSKGDFVGRAGIEAADLSDRPVLVGLVADGRRAARAGAQVRDADGREVGEITSGALSPTLGHPIAMGFVHPSAAEAGTELVADVRDKDLPVRVVETPFRTRDWPPAPEPSREPPSPRKDHPHVRRPSVQQGPRVGPRRVRGRRDRRRHRLRGRAARRRRLRRPARGRRRALRRHRDSRDRGHQVGLRPLLPAQRHHHRGEPGRGRLPGAGELLTLRGGVAGQDQLRDPPRRSDERRRLHRLHPVLTAPGAVARRPPRPCRALTR